MKTYSDNSPEAIARVLAMTMITDARLDDRELDAMETFGIYRKLGLTKEEFAIVVADYCDELVQAGDIDGKINLMDHDRIEAILAPVTDAARQLDVASMVLAIVKADGGIHDTELELLRTILDRWDLSLEDIRAAADRL